MATDVHVSKYVCECVGVCVRADRDIDRDRDRDSDRDSETERERCSNRARFGVDAGKTDRDIDRQR